ncbi:hypothetical protein HPB52_022428 [Rhipicephalus sanguineus]|uniref:Uncharacterized protein n=1 Tax=Rhipicephalus sanguineus TaxID=34632 RepID=A0A9D4Q447_RHISA|nr:hypothetical protein HPB52_022428 [Rhipicephalus sanguineus]
MSKQPTFLELLGSSWTTFLVSRSTAAFPYAPGFTLTEDSARDICTVWMAVLDDELLQSVESSLPVVSPARTGKTVCRPCPTRSREPLEAAVSGEPCQAAPIGMAEECRLDHATATAGSSTAACATVGAIPPQRIAAPELDA